MSHIYEIIRDCEDKIAEFIENQFYVKVPAEKVGLDRRAGYLYVGEDCIITSGETRMLEYYGGFEYIHPQDRESIGRFTIWYDTSDRVRECIEYYDELAANTVEKDVEYE